MPSRTALFLHLARRYWGARPSVLSWAMLGFALITQVGGTWVAAWYTDVQKSFFDSMTARDPVAFRSAVMMTLVVLMVSATVGVLGYIVQRVVEASWRQAMTGRLFGRWMRGPLPYRIKRNKLVDNADQRISEDARMYCEPSLTLVLRFHRMAANRVVFVRILWQDACDLALPLGSRGTFIFPVYLFVVAVAWRLVQTGLTHLAGQKIAWITVAQQKAKADFRFALAKSRGSAEQIALYHGDAVERHRLGRVFVPIRMNRFQLIVQNMKLTFVNLSLGLFVSVVPFLAAAPKVMSRQTSIGTLMQRSIAFEMALMSVLRNALLYPRLVVFSAVFQRRIGLEWATEAEEFAGIRVQTSPSISFATDGLDLRLPDGTPVSHFGDVEIRPGERALPCGRTGSGKRTLLRAIAELWPFGRGRIVVPAGARMMILPQKSCIADGRLKEAIAHPLGSDEVADDDRRRALEAVDVGHLPPRLGEHHRWGHRLSGGGQQTPAFVRAMLCRLDFLFLDEATSALDESAAARLHGKLFAELTACTLVSVANRTTVERFHDRQLTRDPTRS